MALIEGTIIASMIIAIAMLIKYRDRDDYE
jgi:hypothetical protein